VQLAPQHHLVVCARGLLLMIKAAQRSWLAIASACNDMDVTSSLMQSSIMQPSRVNFRCALHDAEATLCSMRLQGRLRGGKFPFASRDYGALSHAWLT
jgi:hypothetical protein